MSTPGCRVAGVLVTALSRQRRQHYGVMMVKALSSSEAKPCCRPASHGLVTCICLRYTCPKCMPLLGRLPKRKMHCSTAFSPDFGSAWPVLGGIQASTPGKIAIDHQEVRLGRASSPEVRTRSTLIWIGCILVLFRSIADAPEPERSSC